MAAASFFGAACQVSSGLGTVGGFDHDVSEKGELWGAYRSQSVYRLERDVFLLDVPDRTNGRALVSGPEWPLPPGTYRGPIPTADYQALDGYRGVIGVIPAGTRIRAESLRSKGNLRDRGVQRNYVKARILDGEYRGWVVDLEPLSIYTAGPEGGPDQLTGPNEDFLRWVS